MPRGKRDLITVIGHAATNREWCLGDDRTHGPHFKAQVLRPTAPTTPEGIERYLASGQMRGIGPAMAKRIGSVFGEATFEMIEGTPERLKEVAGIGPM